MRIWHRLTAFVPLLLTVVLTVDARAQPMSAFPSFGNPAFMAGPQGGQAGYGMQQPFQSYPMISPFDNALEQTFSSDGLWFSRLLTQAAARNRYYFNVDYLRTKTRGMSGLVGNENAATFTQLETMDGTGGTFPDSLTLNNFNGATATLMPRVRNNGVRLSGGIRNEMGWGFGWDASWNSPTTSKYDATEATLNQRIFAVDALMLEAADGEGLIRTGFNNLDERQFAIDNILNRPDGEIITDALARDFGILGTADEVLDRVLLNLHAISLINHDPEDFAGVAQRFDFGYTLLHRLDSFETGMHFTWTPVYETDTLTVSPLFGARFIRVNEAFTFLGADSGLDYTANIADGVDDDDDFIVDNVDENGTATFTEGNPSESSFIMSMIDTYVQSNLVGPEAGLQFSYGDDDSLKITGSTRIGAFFNTERSKLAGDNIFDTSADSTEADPDPAALRDRYTDGFDTTVVGGMSGGSARATNPSNTNFFTDSKSSTHVSPVFRQTLEAEYPIFSRVPVLRDVWQLEGARIRAGWSYLWIGEFADPQQSINYVSNPRQNIFPTLDVKRSSFFQNQFNLGINWEF